MLIGEPDDHQLLIPVNPARYRFLFWKRIFRECLKLCLIRFEEMPLNPFGRGVELTDDIVRNHSMQFAG
jgi:hypothetical protein